METAHLNELIALEESYWWHVAKRKMVTSLLQKLAAPQSQVVEGGIGACGNLIKWQSLGYQVAGLDVMPEAIENAKARGLTNVHLHDLHQEWPIEPGSSRAVVLLDVLEHLKEPSLALHHASKVLAQAGKIIFTVPAYPSLFSTWDERLGHYRRYTMEMIRKQVSDAGLNLQFVRHWNAFSLPAALAIRSYRRWRPKNEPAEFPRVSPLMNRSLIGMASIEQFVANRLGLPCGLSLVGVIQK